MLLLGIIISIIALAILIAKKTGDTKIPYKYSFIVFGLGLFMMLSNFIFFYANPGVQYYMVFPNGKQDAVMEQGVKWRGFAKITPWSKWVDVKVTNKDAEGADEVEGKMKPIGIRFIDQVTATVALSTRFQLPSVKQDFIDMAVEFRTSENLVQNTLIPTVKEVVSNTGYMFAAQDYISGSASDFRVSIEDQLEGGSFSVEKKEYRDTIVTGISEKNREIREIKTRYEVIKRKNSDGKYIRIAHDIKENNISVSQVIVDGVILETVFKQRLEAQRDESAKRQLEQQKIKTAKDAQMRIIAEGERDKAAERVTQEKKQIQTLISKETMLKEEETNKKLAAIQLETEKINSTKRKVKADADAYEIRKKVIAGITPETKLKMELQRDVDVAKAISNIKFPQYMNLNNGGKGNSASPMEALLGAKLAKDLLTTTTTK